MAKAIRLPRITRELVQCQMCGYCIDVCEAHRMTPWESVTPRGKIYYLNQLDKAGIGIIDKVIGRKATISPDFVDAMYKCTGCGNMTTEADMKAYEKRVREEEKAAKKAAKKEEKAAKRAK